MTVIVKYVECTEQGCKIHESFLGFEATSATGEGLAKIAVDKLIKEGLLVENIRGQGYDNGANMKGKNAGV